MRSGECDVVSLYVLCCSVCFVCCVFDSVCELLVKQFAICLGVTYLLVVTCGCSAASNWKPGPHAVSTIVKCIQSPGCC